MMRYYGIFGQSICEFDETGKGPDEGWIEMSGPRPESTDFTAQSNGTWLISQETVKAKLVLAENEWVETQMGEIAEQLLMLDDEDPSAKQGTARQWRDYRIELRKWTGENPDFPDSGKRPLAPS
jgi:hypothetical protein